MNGKYTLELFAEKKGLTRQSALNLLSKLKKQGLVKVSGGGRQKRIYTLFDLPKKEPNGFFYVLNKYSKEKINPSFEHYVYGKYSVEHALIDGILLQIKQKDIRIRVALYNLFRHVKNWNLLFFLARKHGVENHVQELYAEAKEKTKVRKLPKRYLK